MQTAASLLSYHDMYDLIRVRYKPLLFRYGSRIVYCTAQWPFIFCADSCNTIIGVCMLADKKEEL